MSPEDEELINEAKEAVRNAIFNYLRANCRRDVSMASITGQKFVKVSFYGLFRYYEPTENFPRFSSAYEFLKSRNVNLGEVIGIREVEVVEENGELHLVFKREVLERLCYEVLGR